MCRIVRLVEQNKKEDEEEEEERRKKCEAARYAAVYEDQARFTNRGSKFDVN